MIPTELQDIGIRAFCGCEQLVRFTPLDGGEVGRTIQAEHNAFLMCNNFERASWVELLPPGQPDSDAWTKDTTQVKQEYASKAKLTDCLRTPVGCSIDKQDNLGVSHCLKEPWDTVPGSKCERDQSGALPCPSIGHERRT